MPLTAKQMVKLLKKNGFVEVRQMGSHKQFKNHTTGRFTTVPYHCRDLNKKTEQAILKQAGLR